MTFLQFLRTLEPGYNFKGDFIRQALGDKQFPNCFSKACIKARLAIAHASTERLGAFEALWADYEKVGRAK